MIETFDYGEVMFFRMARTLFGRAIYWTGIYYVDGLLVDSGPSNLRREVRGLFRELEIQQAVTTHHHEDHTGNHAMLQEEFGVTPLAHGKAVHLLREPEVHLHLYRRVVWGAPRPSRLRAFEEGLETPSFRFQVVETPGHSQDHVVLFEPERRWLFSGDLYLAPKLKVLRSDEDVHALADSLRRVMELEPKVLFCQHRGRVEQAMEVLRMKHDFLVELGARVKALHAQGLDETEIARALPGNDFLWRLGTGGHFSKLNFVRAFLSPRRRMG
ncbi:MAG: MBL fold metallo-hydrolase [Acidobacteriota bacterium]